MSKTNESMNSNTTELDQESIKENFIKKRGYWSEEIWGSLLEMDKDFLNEYLNFSSVPFAQGNISLKNKELIYIAFDVAATHLYTPGTKVHMQNALKYGAMREEIMDVIEIASLIGIQSFNVAAPILIKELKDAGEEIDLILNEEQQNLKEEFIRIHGYWNDAWQASLLLNSEIFSAYLGLANVPIKKGHLDKKMRELIFLTVDVASTHLYEKGIRTHIQNALKLNVTKEEIIEVLQLTSTLGIHAATVNVPILHQLTMSD